MNKKKQYVCVIIISIFLTIIVGAILRSQTFDKSEISQEITEFAQLESGGYQIQDNKFKCLTDDPLLFLNIAYGNEIIIEFDASSISPDGVLVQLFYPINGQYSLDNSITRTATKENNVISFRNSKFIDSKIRIDIGQAEDEFFAINNIKIIHHYFSIYLTDAVYLLLLWSVFLGVLLAVFRYKIWHILFRFWKVLDFIPAQAKKIENKWEKLEKIKKSRFFIAFLSQLIIIGIMLLLGHIRYIVNDDTTMIAIAGGGYGEPSQYVINLHIWIGYFLKFMFQHFPGINWITVLYLIIYVFSFFVLDSVFFCRNESFKNYGISLAVTDLCFLILISHFTFTVVAYTALSAGSIAIIHAINEDKVSYSNYFVFGSIALLMGFLIRAEAMKSILIIIFVYGIVRFIEKRQIRYFGFILVSLFMLYSLTAINMEAYKKHPVQKEFIEWGELRSKALDCKKVEFDEAKLAEKGISKAGYDAIYNAFYYVEDVVSKENMESLIQLNTLNKKYNIDIFGFLKYYFSFLKSIFLFENFYKILFFICMIGSMFFGSKKSRLYSCGNLIAIIMVEAAFYFINRSLYRVIMPSYIFAIFLLILIFESSKKKEFWFREHKINLASLEYKLMLVIFTFGLVGKIFDYSMLNSPDYSKERNEVLKYMEENNEKLFLAGDANVFNIGISRSIWDYAGENAKWNLIGNWETYSLVYEELLTTYNINDKKNIIKEAVDNNNILIMTSQGSAFERNSAYILDLIQEYYGFRPQMILVDKICKNPIDENGSEIWRTYKLVNEQ